MTSKGVLTALAFVKNFVKIVHEYVPTFGQTITNRNNSTREREYRKAPSIDVLTNSVVNMRATTTPLNIENDRNCSHSTTTTTVISYRMFEILCSVFCFVLIFFSSFSPNLNLSTFRVNVSVPHPLIGGGYSSVTWGIMCCY